MVTMFDLQNFLDNFPSISELKKRAELLAEVETTLPMSFNEKSDLYRLDGDAEGTYIVTHWEDGGGQSTSIFFTDEATLVLVYDHECPTNFYYSGEEDDAENQLALFDGVPASLMRFVRNVKENQWNLNIDIPTGGTISSASGVAWNDAEGWHYSPAFDQYLEVEEYQSDGGFRYCTRPFIVDKASITEEDVVKTFEDQGYDEDEDFDVIREAYRRIYN